MHDPPDLAYSLPSLLLSPFRGKTRTQRRHAYVLTLPFPAYPNLEGVLMAGSWQEAKEAAKREGLELVFHDLDSGHYGACKRGDRQGAFSCGKFVEHRTIAQVADQTVEEMEEKERRFLQENPDY
jgi:hypothetical protein